MYMLLQIIWCKLNISLQIFDVKTLSFVSFRSSYPQSSFFVLETLNDKVVKDVYVASLILEKNVPGG